MTEKCRNCENCMRSRRGKKNLEYMETLGKKMGKQGKSRFQYVVLLHRNICDACPGNVLPSFATWNACF